MEDVTENYRKSVKIVEFPGSNFIFLAGFLNVPLIGSFLWGKMPFLNRKQGKYVPICRVTLVRGNSISSKSALGEIRHGKFSMRDISGVDLIHVLGRESPIISPNR